MGVVGVVGGVGDGGVGPAMQMLGLNPPLSGVHLSTPSEYIPLQLPFMHWEFEEHCSQSPSDDYYTHLLQDKNFKNFLMSDGTTKEGQDRIADFYQVTELWKQMEKSECNYERYFKLLQLVKMDSPADYLWVSFVEEKRDGTIKARKVIGGNKQRDYITKQDVSSPTVTAEAVMLTCVIDAQENRDVAVVDIPNAFVQTVVSDEDAEHRVMVRIRGPLVDILVSMAPDVYGPYVSVTKTGQKVLIVECLNAVYGTMVAALLYYKKFVKSLKSKGFKLNPYDGCVANKIVLLATSEGLSMKFLSNSC